MNEQAEKPIVILDPKLTGHKMMPGDTFDVGFEKFYICTAMRLRADMRIDVFGQEITKEQTSMSQGYNEIPASPTTKGEM